MSVAPATHPGAARHPSLGGNPIAAAEGLCPLLRGVAAGRGVLLLALLALAPLRADVSVKIPTLPGSGVNITVSTPVSQMPRFGFLPVRLTIENASSAEHTWQLRFEAGQPRSLTGVLASDFSLAVPAGQTRETWCYVPLAEAGLPVATLVNSATVGGGTTFGGSRAGSMQPQVKITPTPSGVKITRSFPSGAPFSGPMVEEEIDRTTGVRTMTAYSTTGAVTSHSTNTPPAGTNVTYRIDPSTGNVSMSATSSGSQLPGALPKVTIITGTITPPPAPSQVVPRVTIADTPTGKKVTRTTQLRTGSLITETEFDTTTGKIALTNVDSSGNIVSNRTFDGPKPGPGFEVTYSIDPVNGGYSASTRKIGGTAPTKYLVLMATPSPGAMMPTARWSNFSGLPVVAEVAGAGISGVSRANLPISTGATPMRLFALGPQVDAAVRRALAVVVRGGAPSVSSVDPAQLPADWRAWSPFSGVIFSAEEYAGLDPARRAALRGWVAMGGHLFLSPAFSGEEQKEKIGAGEVVTWAEPIDKLADAAAAAAANAGPPAVTSAADEARLAAVAAEVARRRAAAQGGATGGAPGMSGPFTSVSATMTPTGSDLALADFWINSVKIYEGTPGQPDRESLYLRKTKLADAADRGEDGASWLSVFLFMFAGIIAPINLFIFAPAGKRHRLFWTTPLISAAAAIVLAVFIVFQDGLGGSGRRVVLVAFVPGSNEAAVFQEQAFNTGFLPRRNFPLASDTILAELTVDDTQRYPTDFRYVRTENRGDGDWFRNRSGEAQLVRRLTPTRGRIELVGAGPSGEPVVQSSLGVALKDFSCVDAAGKLWKCNELVPGRRVTLVPGRLWFATLAAPKASKNFSEVLAATAPQSPLRWGARGPAGDLAPIATLDAVKWEDSDVLYSGVLERIAVAKGAAQ